MDETTGTNPLTILVWGVLIFDAVLYLLLKGVGVLINRIAGREAVSARWVGAIAVMIFTVCASIYLATTTMKREAYAHLEPFDQGQYLGYTVSIALIPGILVLGVVAYRGRRKTVASR